MSFIYGTELAILQDKCFNRYMSGKIIPKRIKRKIDHNIWIKVSERIAPNNLVIRNYAISDLLKNKPKNTKKITKLVDTLSGSKDDSQRIWLEGYSYWKYTLSILSKYIEVFSLSNLSHTINCINYNFFLLSYFNKEKLWPPPYGDLRKISLLYTYDIKLLPEKIRIGPISKSKNRYSCEARPLGLNGHTPVQNSVLVINEKGILINAETFKPLKWYLGYEKKYPTKKEELKDLLKKERILSIFDL